MLNINEIKEKLKRMEEKRKKSETLFIRFEEGDNIFRFLPIDDLFYFEVFRHRIKTRFYICPKTYDSNSDCPICELVTELREEGSIDEAKSLLARTRYYSVVVKKEADKERLGIIAYGNQIWSALAGLAIDKDWGDFTDRENGYAINIKKIGSGLETRYQVLPRPKKAVPLQKWNEWLANMPDLKSVLKALSYEELSDIIEGIEGRESE